MAKSSFVLLAFLIVAEAIDLSVSSGLEAMATENQAEEVAKKIPLSGIYTTSGQKDLIPVHFIQLKDESVDKIMKALNASVGANGASNVFLVGADNIKDAIRGTYSVFAEARSADKIVNDHVKVKPKNTWAVVYFGIAGSGKAWLINSAQIKGNVIRVHYKKGTTEVSDSHNYFAWIPVGELAPGNYQFQLFNDDTMQIALARTVEIAN